MTDEIFKLLQIITPIILFLVGLGVKLILSELREQRDTLREYVRKETCAAHREQIQRQLEAVLRNK